MDRTGDRKGSNRTRILRAVPTRESGKKEGPTQEIVGVTLGDRMVFSEHAEVWTMRGIRRDGSLAPESVGELSFVLIPGTQEPATAVVGFIAPAAPQVLAANEDAIWAQIRSMVVQLGYDADGFYASLSLGGKPCYFEDYRSER